MCDSVRDCRAHLQVRTPPACQRSAAQRTLSSAVPPRSSAPGNAQSMARLPGRGRERWAAGSSAEKKNEMLHAVDVHWLPADQASLLGCLALIAQAPIAQAPFARSPVKAVLVQELHGLVDEGGPVGRLDCIGEQVGVPAAGRWQKWQGRGAGILACSGEPP